MKRRVLLGTSEAPGFGGAGASAYALFRSMRRGGRDAHFVSLIERWDMPYFQYIAGESSGNPEGLPDVETCILTEPLLGPQEQLVDLIARIGPDVMVGCDCVAADLLKRAAPER